jgi:hypothetical protein
MPLLPMTGMAAVLGRPAWPVNMLAALSDMFLLELLLLLRPERLFWDCLP